MRFAFSVAPTKTVDATASVSEADAEVVRVERRPRSLLTIAYTAATLFGGLGALVVLVVTLTSAGDAGALDVLLWGALAVLLLAAAAHQWWFAPRESALSRRPARPRSQQPPNPPSAGAISA